MLRITRKANGEVVFKVSGQLNSQNVAEIGTLIEAEKKGSRIVLDLTDLRSVDGEAVKFLERWEADSIKLKNWPRTSESGSAGDERKGRLRRERRLTSSNFIWQEEFGATLGVKNELSF